MSTAIDRVQKRFPKLTRSVRRASLAAKIFNAQTKSMRQNLQKLGGGMKRVGVAMTLGITLPLAALGAQSVRSFGDFQQGLRGIEKTTGLSRLEVGRLGQTFDRISTIIPVSTKEMLELAQAGGQLGIKGVKNIEKFTVTLAKLSRASDVAGESGAKSIARILKVTGEGIGQVDRFSAALVDLGNNAAASEQEILEVATRVAGQIGRFDVASASVLGISTALKALGKRSEAAGSVVGRAFDAIDQAIKGGGKQMQFLSKLTGIAGKDLAKTFKKDAAAVFQKFVSGLNKVQTGGGNLVKAMGALGLQGVRINDILGTLAKRPEVLAENMDRASRAFIKNTALQKEFMVQTDSFNSSMKVISNTFTSLTRLIGKDLAPAVSFLGKIFKGIFNFLRNNPTIRTLVIVFSALAAALGPILFITGAFLVILPSLIAGFVALGVASFPITGSVLAIAAGIAAVIGVSVILIKKWGVIKSFFNENPFGQFLKFIFLVFTPLGQLISLVRLVVASFSGLKGIKGILKDTFSVFGFGDESKKGFGASVGARKQSQGVAQGPLTSEPLKGSIGVLFQNAPAGTKIRSEADAGLGLDVGLVGGLQ